MKHKSALLTFPTHFPIKVFGPNTEAFIKEISTIAKTHFPKTLESDIHCAFSGNNNYVSITINVYVESQKKLDALYQQMTQHPDSKMVL